MEDKVTNANEKMPDGTYRCLVCNYRQKEPTKCSFEANCLNIPLAAEKKYLQNKSGAGANSD